MPLQDYNSWDLKPQKLSKEEIANPYSVIHQLFEFAHLPELRKMNRDYLKVLLLGNYKELTQKEASELFSFFEKTEKLIEAAHLIDKQKRSDENTEQVSASFFFPIKSLVDKESELLLQLLQIIVTIAPVKRIFLLSAYQYSDMPHFSKEGYTLLVILNEHDTPSEQYEYLIEMVCKEIAEVAILYINEKELQGVLQEGHLFYSLVCTKEKLVYDTGSNTFTEKEHIKDESSITKAKEVFAPLFARAEALSEGARHYYLQNENELSTFMLYQAIVQSIGTLLLAIAGFQHRNRDLKRLLILSTCITPELLKIFSLPNEQDNHLLPLLQSSSENVKHNKAYEIKDADLELLLNKVIVVLPAVKIAFENWIKELKKRLKFRDI